MVILKKLLWLLMLFIIIISSSMVLGALTDDIISHYNFDNDTYIIDSLNRFNGTYISTSQVNGLINYGRNFTATTNNITINVNNSVLTDRNWTINLWFNMKTNQYGGLFTKTSLSTTRGIRLYTGTGTDDLNLIVSNSTGTECAMTNIGVTNTQYNGSYHMITIFQNVTNLTIYYDNTFLRGMPCTITPAPANDRFNIGTQQFENNLIDTIVDEYALWDRPLTIGEIDRLWNNGTGLTYPFNETTTPTILPSYNISIVRTPTDINSSLVGIVEINATITNLTGNNSIGNNSYATLYYNITTSGNSCPIYEQTQCSDGTTHIINMTKYNNSYYNISLLEYQIFPGYYPYSERYISTATTDYNYSVYNNNNIRFMVQNFTTLSNPYISMEFDAQNISGSSIMGIYYCNSSYTVGYPLTDSNCEFLQSIPALAFSKSHCHANNRSCHYVMPVYIRNVTKTQNSSFIVVSSSLPANGYNFRYVLNSSYDNRSFQIGNYNVWSATNYIFDMHIHSFNESTDSFNFRILFNDGAGSSNTTTLFKDYFNVVNQKPSATGILRPNSTERPTITTANTSIFFLWTPSYDYENDTLTYNISLLSSLNVPYKIGIFAQNVTNYTASINNAFIPAGYYTTEIITCDNNSNCAIGIGKDTFYLCENSYSKSVQPCNSGTKLIVYQDDNDCDTMLNIPADNNTYETCVEISYVQKTYTDDMLILIVLGFFILVSLICAIFVHEGFFGLTALMFSLMLYTFLYYDYPQILVYAIVFIILLLLIMWIVIRKMRT